jgi:soluble lytic murein transglycosylase-like protein
MKHGVLCAPLLLSVVAPSAFYGQSLPENRYPEAVYYADAYADHYDLPRQLVHAIIAQESGWNPNAVSSKGAVGLMQLMPATAYLHSVQDRRSIRDNIGGGVRYLAELNRLFRGDLRLIVAGYYCGEHRIARSGLQYQNSDVIDYVRSVERRYENELRLHRPNSNNNHGKGMDR